MQRSTDKPRLSDNEITAAYNSESKDYVGREYPPSPKTYDDRGLLRFVFIGWAKSWVNYICTHFVTPETVHRLPKADQISYWQPILSKHISDGLLRLEKAESDAVLKNDASKRTTPYRSVLLRAILLTFWRRIVLTLLLMMLMSITTVGTVVLLKHLLKTLSQKDQVWGNIVGVVLSIVGVEVLSTFLDQHTNLYNMRLQNVMEVAISLTLFQHGLCHRKDYTNAMQRCAVREGCKGAVHSWPPVNDSCCEDPLVCPARRHKNNELPPSMYTFLFVDTYFIISLVDATVMLMRFACNMTLGMVLIYTQTGMSVLWPMLVIVGITLLMVLVEAVNGLNISHALQSKDERISKSSEIIGSMKLLEMMGIEDVGYEIMKNSRDDELSVLQTRLTFFSINRSLMRVIGTVVYLVVIIDFIRKLKIAPNDSSFDISAPITLLHIVSTIVGSFDHLLKSLKMVVEGVASMRRVERFIRECSPNFYATRPEAHSDTLENELTVHDPRGDSTMHYYTLVLFKNASFSWLASRQDALTPKDTDSFVLANITFELERGDVKIITGNQGCGKTSFIKAMLGEMSLVSGSMAVAPLSTGMPIFYTSQEVWLPSGSIRSIITFGYAFDEDIYRQVTCAVELESDFASWEDGDMRVISEKGYSLSGGQRVRLSLARALYAYLIFSKANERLVGDRCCFLVCLDEPFNGLDPAVAGTIFNNLFNKETGLLVRDDVAVVMAMSPVTISICTSLDILDNLVEIHVHNITGGQVSIMDFMGKQPPGGIKPHVGPYEDKISELENKGPYNSFATLRKSNLMDSKQYGFVKGIQTRRAEEDHEMHNSPGDVEAQNKKCLTGPAYGTYISAMGIWYSVAVSVLLTSGVALDKVFGVLVARWSDLVKRLENQEGDDILKANQIMSEHEETARKMGILATIFIILIFAGMFTAIFANIRASRRIHEYIMNSLFNKSSTEAKVKGSLATTVTFLSSDIYYIDEHIGRFIVATLFSLLSICVQFITICYSTPILSPIPIVIIIVLYFFVCKSYLMASKKLQWVMLEANNSINAVYGDVISGSEIYRSFRREQLCVDRVRDYSESFFGIKFLKIAVTSWAMLTCKLFISFMVLSAAFVPVLYAYVRGVELKVAQVGLGISYSLGINALLNTFIFNFSMLEKQMCSMVRFREYFLQTKIRLDAVDKKVEMVPCSSSLRENAEHMHKHLIELIQRRKHEFRQCMFRRYRSIISTLLYRPKFEFVDIGDYFAGEHMSLELDNVMVPEPAEEFNANKNYILKGVTASTRAGDVVGIVGRTGAGKSTLLSVLQNIASKREGSVLLDGRELNSIPRKVLRHIIGVLPQMPFVFKGWTLRRFLDPRMLHSDEEILHALECCGLLDMVKSLPGTDPLDAVLAHEDIRVQRGYYVIIPLIRLKRGLTSTRSDDGEGGVSGERPDGNVACFSMSQLRSLSFARLVLYRMTYRILLIDEPPSDNCAGHEDADQAGGSPSGAEASSDASVPIYDLVRMFFSHCTTFIVAHDKNVLRSCTSVWLMQSGTLVERCSTQEFMARGMPSTGVTDAECCSPLRLY
ncbi:ATP-BINDING CASSETTE TRANSPORTER, putative [Babesia bigemina]|uniref:ATP-BINDING CASSETTE TRANSPORTER, putative n=1 Tax=Babesia bigemina TaxID=5866 RepID=A0A061D8F5_BABBI|nr:ATP-BINDING CASSETTE TRANSPORTER, putative [Babesia bigemina]CDR96986.1 ATP-BINDING CASSETTE TRANSPORTER, putative [Babesia bigemina]|eukprot:XP_012769172.1 ATP-BINDING CASSETTE TRANSPORTER, putative [Babesia bigemina]